MNQTITQKPVVAVTLGDPGGIGPELIARLLARSGTMQTANVVLVGDPWLWAHGQEQAGMTVATQEVGSFAEVRERSDTHMPAFLAMHTVDPAEVQIAVAAAPGGRSVLQVLNRCMDAARAGEIDAICFAPLNKHAMKQGGLRHEDELHHFAEYLGVDSYFCEFNTLEGIWTSRISSHVPLKDVPKYIERKRVVDAAALLYSSLQASGVAQPRVAVAGLNPHNGEGGTCGREEIDVIAPAVAELQAQGFSVTGPFPADTIFLQARDGQVDGIVTMYHDQGQIALKLMGFSRGVTVQGGLPVPITTPAHGTAYDIAGKGKADVNATANAFAIAARMGAAYRTRHLFYSSKETK
ncbi:4-hydroxythreonine-4-phosphate dehydrogenase PdxA [Noviherbaspirillum saxi]|uniref:4-hydroxythreonine-4-phosphate dehydrogenase PdxA n=1 Tax=Noviherbaspirillum saxi TaxID=2320863 RepID=A0A3A3FN18_9BURK|nr:4-hydroxythreonine-4-phosphate dehydrogenase PdxA [Noviherbaspirillum saxi]RJF95865.1 4-hydroxythreonine-4-phosphate dehydrogenase PdxA [Noviherbaspirillum saxi]